MSRISLNIESSIARFILFIFFSASLTATDFGQNAAEPDVRSLTEAQAIERQITGVELHQYKIALQTDEFLQITIVPKVADVVVKLLNSDGKILAKKKAGRNEETLSFIPTSAGDYVVEVSGVDAKAAAGSYTIRRGAARKATEQERLKMKAENANATAATGKWIIVVTTKQGDLQFTLDLKQENENLSGSVKSTYGDGTVTRGTIEDNIIKLDLDADLLEVKLNGTLDGDKMKGTVTSNIPNIGELPFVGTRVK